MHELDALDLAPIWPGFGQPSFAAVEPAPAQRGWAAAIVGAMFRGRGRDRD